MKIVFLYCPTI